jgi:flagellar operon protein
MAINPTSSSLTGADLLNQIDRVGPKAPAAKPSEVKNVKDNDFSKALGQELKDPPIKGDALKFSQHAKTRLESRGIELSSDEILKMQEAVSKASLKGSKESLILTDKAAFVVSVKNNTVITAMDRESMKENIFTNIDSTIMI